MIFTELILPRLRSAGLVRRISTTFVLFVCAVISVLGHSARAVQPTQTIPPSGGPWHLGIDIVSHVGTNPFPRHSVCFSGSTPDSAVLGTIADYNTHKDAWFPAPTNWQGTYTYPAGFLSCNIPTPGYPVVDGTPLQYQFYYDSACWQQYPYPHTLQYICVTTGDQFWGSTSGGTYNSVGIGNTYVRPVRGLYCPPGTTEHFTGSTFDCLIGDYDECPIGDPICPFSGINEQTEVDYRASGVGAVEFVRYYRSRMFYSPDAVSFGAHAIDTSWQHTYERRLLLVNYGGVRAIHESADGRLRYFDATGTELLNRDGAAATLQAQSDGTWTVILPNLDQESFDATGRLTSIKYRGGAVTTIAYGANGLASTITDQFGKSLTLAYDTRNRLASVTLPDATTIVYGFDSSDNLTSVLYPDSSTRTYVYARAPEYLLASIEDESGTTFASFTYDAQRRGTSSQHAAGVESYTFSYGPTSTTVTDPLGVSRTYSITNVNGVTRQSAVSGGRCAICDTTASSTFDANGNPVSQTDFNGKQTIYSYDLTRNLETSRTEAYGSPRARTVTTLWHPTLRVPNLIAEPNRTIGYTYDASGNPLTRTVTDTSATPNVSRTWTYTYNGYGQVLTIDGPRTDVADVTTYTYYSCSTGFQCGQINTVSDAAGHITTMNSYNASGQPTQITDPNGVTRILTYDTRQRLKSVSAAGETHKFNYYPTGLLQQVILPDASYVQYTYDNAHRLTDISDAVGNKIHYTLDSMGNRTSETTYDPSNVLSRTQSHIYNTLGQLSQDIGAAGSPGVTTTYAYDNNGNSTSVIAPLGRNSLNAYDELNRLNQITDPAGGITQFAYDVNDNVTSVVDPMNTTTSYTYTGFGDLKTKTSSITGSSTNTYDSGGNLKTRTDARGATAIYSYDVLNRVIQVAYSDQTINFVYDVGAYGKGHLASGSDANHSVSWTYDARGRVASRGQTVGSITKSVGYGYSSGDLTSLLLPSGQVVNFGYNKNHEVTSISLGSASILSNVVYEPFGSIRGWTWSGGTIESRLHDADGNPSLISGVETRTYTLDNAFRITGITSGSSAAKSWMYGYDGLDRLTSGGSPSNQLSWTYDANGNRKTQVGDSAPGYLGSNITLTYNQRNRLVSFVGTSTASFIYNALGQRVKKTVGTTVTYFAYDEVGHMLGEYDGTGALIEETVWLGDLPVATLRPKVGGGVDVYHIHADHLNAPRIVTRASDNAVVWRWDQDPFGRIAPDQNPTGLGTFVYNLRFPGQYFDPETGFNQNYFRDYDPSIGRYLQSDPIGLQGGINTYAYAQGNPVSYRDPSGLAVYVGQHGAFFSSDPLQHAAIVLVPDNPADFANFAIFQATNGQLATLGGQPTGYSGEGTDQFGYLVGEANYPGDSPCNLHNITQVPTPNGMTDTQFILQLLREFAAYGNNLSYDPFPLSWTNTYNSNGFVSGLLVGAGATPPNLPGFRPGYGNPIPVSH